jgi:tRNA 2-thiouridine synthesizing protein A
LRQFDRGGRARLQAELSRNRFMAEQVELDVRGLNCPLPILKTKKALNTMERGQTLRVQATDRGAMLDFKAFAAQTGHELLEASEANGVYTFVLRKA